MMHTLFLFTNKLPTMFQYYLVFLSFLASSLVSSSAEVMIRDLSIGPLSDSHCEIKNFQDESSLDGVMVLYRGQKLVERRNPQNGLDYQPGTSQHALYSVTKTWVSVLIGMLYRDGFLDWKTEHPDSLTLGDIFAEDVWNNIQNFPVLSGRTKTEKLKALTLGQVMSMRTGYSESALAGALINFGSQESNLIKDLNKLWEWWGIGSKTCFECGEYLATVGIMNYVIKEKTKTLANPQGWDPLEYAQETSFEKVGIFRALGMQPGSYHWEKDTDGVARGSYGLWADLEDMARFGQLLLQQGSALVDGKVTEILPKYYLDEMTTTQSRMRDNPEMLPMGWQVWTWGANDNSGYYCAEGLGWQSICVFPEQEMVIAIQAPLSWDTMSAFASNIAVRNQAVEAIRDGLSCAPTPSPTVATSSPMTSPPTSPPISDNESDDVGNKARESNLNAEPNDEKINVGLIIALVVSLMIICCLAGFLCFKRKKKEEEVLEAEAVIEEGKVTVGVPMDVYESAVDKTA